MKNRQEDGPCSPLPISSVSERECRELAPFAQPLYPIRTSCERQAPSECEDILGLSQSIEICTEPVAQTLSEPFDKLRANGGCIENIGNFPFVLSLSKHEQQVV